MIGIGLRKARPDGFTGKLGEHALPARSTVRLAQRRGAVAKHSLSQRVRVFGWYEDAGYAVLDSIDAARDSGRHYRKAHRSRLERDIWKPFAVRREDHYVDGRIDSRRVGRRTYHANPWITAQRVVDLRRDGVLRLMWAHDHEVRVWQFFADPLPSFAEIVDTLIADHTTDEPEHERAVGYSERCAHGMAAHLVEALRVETSTRIDTLAATTTQNADSLRIRQLGIESN